MGIGDCSLWSSIGNEKEEEPVRQRFLGQIANPRVLISPMQAVQDLWDGNLPEFANEAAAHTLNEGLINSLWNRLTKHQNPRSPFHLTRLGSPTEAQ